MLTPRATTFSGPTVEGFAIETLQVAETSQIKQRIATVLGPQWEVESYGDRGVDFELTHPAAQRMTMAEAWNITYGLKALPGITDAEPLFAVLAPDEDDDDERGFEAAERGDQHLPESDPLDWSVRLANVTKAWQLFNGRAPGADVLVGHPDTGFQPHPEIANHVRHDLDFDFVDNDEDAADDLINPGHVVIHNPGHGTSTASVIVSGAAGRILGVAPGAQIVPFRVARSVVVLSTKNLANAIEMAADRGAHVISMSMGGMPSRRLRKAVEYAQRRGVIVCAAAGNKVKFVVWPAAYDEVIACAACNAQLRPWSGSSRGSKVDITAPGESVWRARVVLNGDGSPQYDDGRGSGTSYAVATVAGVAALWLSYHGRAALIAQFGVEKIPFVFNEILRATARPQPQWGPGYGAGLLDAHAVLTAPLPTGFESAAFAFTTSTSTAPAIDTGGVPTFEHLFDIANTNGFESTDGDSARVKDVLAELLMTSRAELPRRLKEVGHELATRLATDPQLYERVEALLEETEGSAEGSVHDAVRILESDASELLRARLVGDNESRMSGTSTLAQAESCGVELADLVAPASENGTTFTRSAQPSGAVRIRITRDEIELTIDPASLGEQAITALTREGAPEGFESITGAESTTAGFVGLGNVPADKFGGGYNFFRLRNDLREFYTPVLEQVHALGGILTSSGAIRDLGQRATAGRSRTSLHYTGRAIDLFIYTGMQGATDPYLIAPDGGSGDHPLWHVYCVSRDPQTSHPSYDPALIKEGELQCAIWRKGKGYVLWPRVTRYFSLTDVFAKHGWQRIPARSDWRTTYLSCEWWHFQHQSGLVSGQTRFGAELMRAWPTHLVNASGLALNAVWGNQSFRSV